MGVALPLHEGGDLGIYLRVVRALPMLSPKVEREITARFAETRDPALSKRLVESNLRYVVHVALAYKGERAKLLDLIQEGNIGLMKAVEKFDPTQGTKLVTYASPWINAYIRKFILANKRLVRIGKTSQQRTLFSNLNKTRARLERSSGGDVPHAAIALELGVRESDVDDMTVWLAAAESPLDRRSVVGDGDQQDWLPSGAPRADELLESRGDLEGVRRALGAVRDTLSLRDQAILTDRLLAEKPAKLQELAERWGLSRERIRQLEARIKRVLAERMQDFADAA